MKGEGRKRKKVGSGQWTADRRWKPAHCPLLTAHFLLLVFWATPVSAQQSATVQSPEIGADRRVTFRLNAPEAQEV
ncbi:MAG TPA: hypothetical protein VG324_25960, partial [Blastocatellia bacterium]|nr:hypothetical protein [Blastocatellia bacterium]